MTRSRKTESFGARDAVFWMLCLTAAFTCTDSSTVDAKGVVGTQACLDEFHMASPLVLDFSGSPTLQTTPPMASSIHFDLNADGYAEATGWIPATSGFLALDRNGNGRIDDGSEMFGEATRLADGALARHGYEALRHYDADKNSLIDRRDPIFKVLLVWFDRNQDGKTGPGELESLASLWVTTIATSYETIPKSETTRDGGTPFGTVLPFRARFFGPPQCGEAGCRSSTSFSARGGPYPFSRNHLLSLDK